MIAVSTANHWCYITGRETVTYFSKQGERIPSAGTTVAQAKRWPLSKEMVLADAELAKAGLKWTVWRNQMPGIIPKVGDVLQDQYGVRFVVKMVEFQSPGQTVTGEAIPHQRFDLTCLQSQKA